MSSWLSWLHDGSMLTLRQWLVVASKPILGGLFTFAMVMALEIFLDPKKGRS